MRVIVDLNKKTLKVIENERSIFKGDVGADKITLLINKVLTNEYPTITAKLSNGRLIGPYSADGTTGFGNETIDDVTYRTADFTLSKANGFTLSEGKMQVTIWMNYSNGKKEAIGNLLLNVTDAVAYDGGNIIIEDDVTETIVNIREEVNNAVAQVNLNGVKVNELDIKVDSNKTETDEELAKKVNAEQLSVVALPNTIPSRDDDGSVNVVTTSNPNSAVNNDSLQKNYLQPINIKIANLENNKADKTSLDNYVLKQTGTNTVYGNDSYNRQTTYNVDTSAGITEKGSIPIRTLDGNLSVPVTPKYIQHATSKQYVDGKFTESKNYTDTKIADLIGGAPSTLDTLKELSDALKGNKDIVDVLEESIGKKADKSELFSKDYNDLINKPNIPTALSDLNIDVDLGVNADEIRTIVTEMAVKSDEPLIVDDNTIPTTKTVANMIGESGSSGGSNEAKLVERVNWNEGSFDLSKPLEKGIYLIVANYRTSILYVNSDENDAFYGSVISAWNSEDIQTPFKIMYDVYQGKIFIESITEAEEYPQYVEDWTLEIYELPFKVGETQSSASKLYRHEINLLMEAQDIETYVWIELYSSRQEVFTTFEELYSIVKDKIFMAYILNEMGGPDRYIGYIIFENNNINIMESASTADYNENQFYYLDGYQSNCIISICETSVNEL